MATIARSVRRIKQELATLVSASEIQELCRQVGYHWRDRILDPANTIHLFILQIVYRNTACQHLPRITNRSFTASAYCQARARLPVELIRRLVQRVGQRLQDAASDVGRWHGHRVVLLDGSSFSMADTPELQARFGQPGAQKQGCGFPVAHLLATIDAGTGFIRDLIAAPLRTHDMSLVPSVQPHLRAGDLVLADRGFCSFVHLALLAQQGLHACFRVHQRQIVNFKPHRAHTSRRHPRKGQPRSCWRKRHGFRDQEVVWSKPAPLPKWISPANYVALPDTLVVRELHHRLNKRGFRTRDITLVTTLLDPLKYSKQELVLLYGMRWQVETHLRHLKTTLGMEILKCQTVDGVMKEMWMFALVYNLVRKVMLEASCDEGVPLERVSFIDALRWLIHAPMDAAVPQLVLNPQRSGRVEPRVIKRRLKEYLLMKQPRRKLRQALLQGRFAA